MIATCGTLTVVSEVNVPQTAIFAGSNPVSPGGNAPTPLPHPSHPVTNPARAPSTGHEHGDVPPPVAAQRHNEARSRACCSTHVRCRVVGSQGVFLVIHPLQVHQQIQLVAGHWPFAGSGHSMRSVLRPVTCMRAWWGGGASSGRQTPGDPKASRQRCAEPVYPATTPTTNRGVRLGASVVP
jgi:hypothetical protein